MKNENKDTIYHQIIKKIFYCLFVSLTLCTSLFAHDGHILADETKSKQEIHALIDKYVQARETKDTALLESILTTQIDQLVSSGNWRIGKAESMAGMLRSSNINPGSRTIKIEKIRFLNPESAIADAKYEIQNPDGSMRRMRFGSRIRGSWAGM